MIPLVAATGFAFLQHRTQTNKRRALSQFVHEVQNGTMADPRPVVKHFGLLRAAELIKDRVREHPTIKFDGHDRWVQILPVPMAHGRGMGDGYTLVALNSDEPLHSYTLERGCKIDSVSFTKTGVRFNISGKIEYINLSFAIPPEAPEVFDLAWPNGVAIPPQSTSVYTQVFNRHKAAISNNAPSDG